MKIWRDGAVVVVVAAAAAARWDVGRVTALAAEVVEETSVEGEGGGGEFEGERDYLAHLLFFLFCFCSKPNVKGN